MQKEINKKDQEIINLKKDIENLKNEKKDINFPGKFFSNTY
jgi:hypothetical protein